MRHDKGIVSVAACCIVQRLTGAELEEQERREKAANAKGVSVWNQVHFCQACDTRVEAPSEYAIFSLAKARQARPTHLYACSAD